MTPIALLTGLMSQERIPMKILVIDNNTIFRAKLTASLFKQGHDVCDIGYGPETLDVLREYHFDVVTLDLKLLPVNGSAIISRIHEIAPDAAVIVISAMLDVRLTVELIRSGAAACLTKPLDFEVLWNELARLRPVRNIPAAAPSLSLDYQLQSL